MCSFLFTQGTALDDIIVVANKADLTPGTTGVPGSDQGVQQLLAEATAFPREGATVELESPRTAWRVSCKTKEGVDAFVAHLEREVGSRFRAAADDESPLITR